eukprot:XP_001707093.1 Hypothetical protein GL50803_37840 [Giardia lamblia ATCC 50803]
MHHVVLLRPFFVVEVNPLIENEVAFADKVMGVIAEGEGVKLICLVVGQGLKTKLVL